MAAQTLNGAFPSIRLERFSHLSFHFKQPLPSSFPIPTLRSIRCRAAAKSPPTGPLKKRSSSSSSSSSSSTTTNKNNNKNNKKKNNNYNKSNGGVHDSISNSKPLNSSGFEIVNDDDATSTSDSSLPTPLPKPPAGFVVDDRGKVFAASKHRLATLVDPTHNRPLECAIRRVFTSSQGHECMLLCPVDMPVQILKSTGVGWSDVSDEELESILPAAAYALAKIRMYLVYSGYCYTARGGFCYSEEDIFDFHPDGKESDGLPTEGVEITHFNLEGAHYMIYTPSDPLFFVAVKDQNGMLQIADDDLLEDPAIISAIDEETEFNALVEEEAALLESLLGKR